MTLSSSSCVQVELDGIVVDLLPLTLAFSSKLELSHNSKRDATTWYPALRRNLEGAREFADGRGVAEGVGEGGEEEEAMVRQAHHAIPGVCFLGRRGGRRAPHHTLLEVAPGRLEREWEGAVLCLAADSQVENGRTACFFFTPCVDGGGGAVVCFAFVIRISHYRPGAEGSLKAVAPRLCFFASRGFFSLFLVLFALLFRFYVPVFFR